MVESVGFEPTGHAATPDELATRCLRPLSQLSVFLIKDDFYAKKTMINLLQRPNLEKSVLVCNCVRGQTIMSPNFHW